VVEDRLLEYRPPNTPKVRGIDMTDDNDEQTLSERVVLAEEWMHHIIDYCSARDLAYEIDDVIDEAYKWADKILEKRE
jgi:hypothetical protein